MVKPSELPIYPTRASSVPPSYTYQPHEPGVLESGITMARHGLQDAQDQVTEAVLPVFNKARRFSQEVYSSLLEEENLPARVGVITGAGALGLAAGALRGGRVKRVLYMGLGAGAGSALCYPSQAQVAGAKAGRFGKCVRYHVRKSALVAYNYAAGREAGGEFDANIIASSMARVGQFLVRSGKQLYERIFYKEPTTAMSITVAKQENVIQDEPEEAKEETPKESFNDALEESEVVLNIPNSENKEKVEEPVSSQDSDPRSVAEDNVSSQPDNLPSKSFSEVSSSPISQDQIIDSASETELSEVSPSNDVSADASDILENVPSEVDSEPLAKPVAETPVKSVIEAPEKPVLEASENPVLDAPEKPVPEAPVKPEIKPLAVPVIEAPSKPVIEAPSKPVIEAPSKAVAEAPAKPVTEVPAKPVAEAPAKPVIEAPAKPVAEAPAKPVALSEKVLELFPRSTKAPVKGKADLIFSEASDSDGESVEPVEPDHGQSNPEDSDLYTDHER